jgi:hypothetical protein
VRLACAATAVRGFVIFYNIFNETLFYTILAFFLGSFFSHHRIRWVARISSCEESGKEL